ncbi:copper resistance protein CopB, partial [Pseudomonas sp. Choline-3u-10]
MTTRPSRFALIALGVSLSAAAGGTANAAEMMDHSMHQTPPAEAAQAPASSAKPAAKNHGSGGQTDHSAMGHGAMDHST